MLQQAEQANPGARASAAQASAAQAYYVAALSNPDKSVSVPAAQNMVNSVTQTVATLNSLGSSTSAKALINETLQQLRSSPAANTPEIMAMIAKLTELLKAQPKSLITEADAKDGTKKEMVTVEIPSYGETETSKYGEKDVDSKYGEKPYGEPSKGGSRKSKSKKKNKSRKSKK
jgi:hypothetical protein